MKTVTTIATIISSLLAGCSGSFEDDEIPMTSSTGGTMTDTGMVSGGNTAVSSGGADASGGDTSDNTGGNDPVATGGRIPNCVPYTCDEITYMKTGDIIDAGLEGSACGAHDDGCGGVAICDTCSDDTFECGGVQNEHYTLSEGWSFIDGQEGVCGGGCFEQSINLAHATSGCSAEKPHYFTCSKGTSARALVHLVPEALSGFNCTNTGNGRFCCATNQ